MLAIRRNCCSHIHAGRVMRAHRGIYRLIHFPPGEHEELVTIWLWSERAGVFSHQTALALHGLSDVLPANVHLTLPGAWRNRRFRIPDGVILHHSDLSSNEQAWFDAVPITSPRRSLSDCAKEPISPDLLRQAAQQSIRRGLVAKAEITEVEEVLKPFGGLDL
jgi:predicted transcriptional regulator of viral defense system